MLAAVLLCAAGPAATATLPTNFIFLLGDDTGWGDVGYHGGRALTPHLDAMASSPGVLRLERFYSGAPVCSPTRASAQTGRTPRRDCIFGVEVHALPKTEFTLAKAAAKKGMATAHFGKWCVRQHASTPALHSLRVASAADTAVHGAAGTWEAWTLASKTVPMAIFPR